MLVLLGPTFEGTDDEYARLARVTGMVVYDLRTKLKPGLWGVVKALGDPAQAGQLAAQLKDEGFQIAILDAAVNQDPERRAAIVRAVKLGDEQVAIQLQEREMQVPYGALLTLVRGEVRIGERPAPRSGSMSSATLRAVTQGDLAAYRASGGGGQFDAFAAADIHFITVPWIARIDARKSDFSVLGDNVEGTAQALDRFVDMLAERSGIPVDRGSHTSSVASFAGGAPRRAETPAPIPSQRTPGEAQQDERFDAYSRMIGEAERQTRKYRKPKSAE